MIETILITLSALQLFFSCMLLRSHLSAMKILKKMQKPTVIVKKLNREPQANKLKK